MFIFLLLTCLKTTSHVLCGQQKPSISSSNYVSDITTVYSASAISVCFFHIVNNEIENLNSFPALKFKHWVSQEASFYFINRWIIHRILRQIKSQLTDRLLWEWSISLYKLSGLS